MQYLLFFITQMFLLLEIGSVGLCLGL